MVVIVFSVFIKRDVFDKAVSIYSQVNELTFYINMVSRKTGEAEEKTETTPLLPQGHNADLLKSFLCYISLS